MMNLEKITDLLIKWDLSCEELFYLQLLYYRKYALIYKYGNYTPIENEWRANPNLGTDKLVGKRMDFAPPYGLPPAKNVLVVGNRARRSITSADVVSLVERGFIEVDIPHTNITMDRFRLSEDFAKEFAFEIGDVIDQLYAAYPKQVLIDGKVAFLTVADKGSMGVLYATAIKKDYDLHLTILEKVKSNADIINFSIEKFIRSEFWNSLEVKEVGSSNLSETL